MTAQPIDGPNCSGNNDSSTTFRLDFKQAMVDEASELAASMAANATHIIETDPDAFELVNERTGHAGSPSRKIDLLQADHMDRYMDVNHIRSKMPRHFHVQSEETHRPFDRAGFFGVGFHVDEFDGTSNARAICSQWSVAVLVFNWSAKYKKFTLIGGSIALADGHGISFTSKALHRRDGTAYTFAADVSWWKWDTFSERKTNSGEPVPIRVLGEIPEPSMDGDPDVVVVNAAGKERYSKVRNLYPRLLDDTEYRSLTAGTPIIFAAALGAVSAIVDPGWSTLHDSTHLFALVALGWKVYDLGTWDKIDLINLAEAHALEPGDTKVFPPNVAVRNEDALRHIKG
jgi:hypothetical protein